MRVDMSVKAVKVMKKKTKMTVSIISVQFSALIIT